MNEKILLTNDDGIHAAGLNAVEEDLESRGIPFFTAAPLYENSGAGHSITLDKPLKIKKFSNNRFGVTGTPTDAVFLGLHELLKEKPVFAVSGINKGGNLGNDITYSGTVAAAIETFYNGITSFAVSLYISDKESFCDDLFSIAAKVLFDIIIPDIEVKIGKNELYSIPHLFNINIPDTALKKKDYKIEWTSLGKRLYGGEVVKRTDPRGGEYYWIGGNQHLFENIEGSDCNAVSEGFISISPLKLSFSNDSLLEKIKNN
ncbi:MAG TPA: 5'/3'-nucleotidase SurE [bacterium]|nr:5'/3'-nucleotidase SurE [bacterium]MDX9804222.1 5'/3'-nucleotidase SurE [bacterium]HPG35321.1 5'/3'-nucleotidase SurE [bacterium]HQM83337.1 5'/3'-nucleotidase SurE [bacterium]